MGNLLNWPLVRERQTVAVGCQQHNSNVYVIFTVPINSSSKLARFKTSQPFRMSSGTSKLPKIEKIKQFFCKIATFLRASCRPHKPTNSEEIWLVVSRDQVSMYVIPSLRDHIRREKRYQRYPPPLKWLFKLFFSYICFRG